MPHTASSHSLFRARSFLSALTTAWWQGIVLAALFVSSSSLAAQLRQRNRWGGLADNGDAADGRVGNLARSLRTPELARTSVRCCGSSLSQHKSPPVLFQPTLSLLEIPINATHERPETRGVAMFKQVAKFVEN
jgi:hypothetical protein